MYVNTYRGPLGMAVTGVIMLVAAALIIALLPVLAAVAAIVSFLGWALITIAIVWALFLLIGGLNNRP